VPQRRSTPRTGPSPIAPSRVLRGLESCTATIRWVLLDLHKHVQSSFAPDQADNAGGTSKSEAFGALPSVGPWRGTVALESWDAPRPPSHDFASLLLLLLTQCTSLEKSPNACAAGTVASTTRAHGAGWAPTAPTELSQSCTASSCDPNRAERR
jgi:hypothetical protein